MSSTGVDQDRLSRILEDLENVGTSEGAPARVSIRCQAKTYGLVANQAGFVHLATEMLRAAAVAPETTQKRDALEPLVRREIRQVFTPDSTLAIDRIERSDELQADSGNASAAPTASPRFWKHFFVSFFWSLVPSLWLLLGGITTTVWATDTFIIPQYKVDTTPVARMPEVMDADDRAPASQAPEAPATPAQ
jgi:hypothetical protein